MCTAQVGNTLPFRTQWWVTLSRSGPNGGYTSVSPPMVGIPPSLLPWWVYSRSGPYGGYIPVQDPMVDVPLTFPSMVGVLLTVPPMVGYSLLLSPQRGLFPPAQSPTWSYTPVPALTWVYTPVPALTWVIPSFSHRSYSLLLLPSVGEVRTVLAMMRRVCPADHGEHSAPPAQCCS